MHIQLAFTASTGHCSVVLDPTHTPVPVACCVCSSGDAFGLLCRLMLGVFADWAEA